MNTSASLFSAPSTPTGDPVPCNPTKINSGVSSSGDPAAVFRVNQVGDVQPKSCVSAPVQKAEECVDPKPSTLSFAPKPTVLLPGGKGAPVGLVVSCSGTELGVPRLTESGQSLYSSQISALVAMSGQGLSSVRENGTLPGVTAAPVSWLGSAPQCQAGQPPEEAGIVNVAGLNQQHVPAAPAKPITVGEALVIIPLENTVVQSSEAKVAVPLGQAAECQLANPVPGSMQGLANPVIAEAPIQGANTISPSPIGLLETDDKSHSVPGETLVQTIGSAPKKAEAILKSLANHPPFIVSCPASSLEESPAKETGETASLELEIGEASVLGNNTGLEQNTPEAALSSSVVLGVAALQSAVAQTINGATDSTEQTANPEDSSLGRSAAGSEASKSALAKGHSRTQGEQGDSVEAQLHKVERRQRKLAEQGILEEQSGKRIFPVAANTSPDRTSGVGQIQRGEAFSVEAPSLAQDPNALNLGRRSREGIPFVSTGSLNPESGSVEKRESGGQTLQAYDVSEPIVLTSMNAALQSYGRILGTVAKPLALPAVPLQDPALRIPPHEGQLSADFVPESAPVSLPAPAAPSANAAVNPIAKPTPESSIGQEEASLQASPAGRVKGLVEGALGVVVSSSTAASSASAGVDEKAVLKAELGKPRSLKENSAEARDAQLSFTNHAALSKLEKNRQAADYKGERVVVKNDGIDAAEHATKMSTGTPVQANSHSATPVHAAQDWVADGLGQMAGASKAGGSNSEASVSPHASQMVDRVEKAIETLQKKSGEVVNFDVGDTHTGKLFVSMRIRDGVLQTSFQTGSKELQSLISREWSASVGNLMPADSVIKVAEPVFNTSDRNQNMDTGSNAQRQQQGQQREESEYSSPRAEVRTTVSEQAQPVHPVPERTVINWSKSDRRLQAFA